MMTMFQRLVRAVRPSASIDPHFERYYSRLLNGMNGAAGAPMAREARQDFDTLWTPQRLLP